MTWRQSGRLRPLVRFAIAVALAATLPYAWAPIYRFPAPTPFSGQHLWNPYETRAGRWQRANLHAHGRAWMGLTSGAQPAAIVTQRYRELGYAVPGVSDYQRISAADSTRALPLYEHGFNLHKSHQLAIGASAVDWFDLPLWQSTSHQQYVIDRVARKAALVGLNHPHSREAYGVEEVRALTGFQLIEVANGPFTSEDVWDAALSAGRPVWALANDDTHDVTDLRRTAVAWNMIDASSASAEDVIGALSGGRSYAVLRTGALDASDITTLSSVAVEGHALTVSLNGAASTVTFIGQDGVVRDTIRDTHRARYVVGNADTYVRTVVTSPQTTLYLNPVIRWNGAALPSPTATVDAALTWTQRGGFALGLLVLAARTRLRRERGVSLAMEGIVSERV